MPAKVKVQVHEARDLPVMDSSTQLTDAYVEIKFNNTSQKTHIAKKTLNPHWGCDFRFEADDENIQDEVLEVCKRQKTQSKEGKKREKRREANAKEQGEAIVFIHIFFSLAFFSCSMHTPLTHADKHEHTHMPTLVYT